MKFARVLMLFTVTVVLALSLSVVAQASGEKDVVPVTAQVVKEAAGTDISAEPIARSVDDPWAPERQMIQDLKEMAIQQIAAVEAQIAVLQPGDPSVVTLEKEIQNIKIQTELQVLEIRLSVAQQRGMTRHIEEITEAIRCLREEPSGEPVKVVERADAVRPVTTTQPDQVKKRAISK